MVVRWKKNKNCTPEERASGEKGDAWDHTAVEPSTKLVVSLVQGPSRDQETTDALVEDFASRTGNKAPEFVTTDEHAPYKPSLLKTYGIEYRPRRKAKRGPKRKVKKRPPKNLTYATVNKTRRKGRVAEISTKVVFGTEEDVATKIASSSSSNAINTAFVERQNGTARHFNARKQRRTYSFSKQLAEHQAMTWLTVTRYNFCWTPRTLRVKTGRNTYQQRTPAMAAGIADEIWSIEHLLGWQALGEVDPPAG